MGDEENTEWSEHWLIFRHVSQAATEAIESVGGRVVRMGSIRASAPYLYGVCLLYDDNDDEQGFTYFTDDGEKARKLFISSPDEGHDLYIHCQDDTVPCFESSVTDLCLVTEAEWFARSEETK